MCPTEVAANTVSGKVEVSVVQAGLEDSGGQKTGGSKASTGPRYGPQGLGDAVEDISAAGALNMHVDETRCDYSALGVEDMIAGHGCFELADLFDDAVLDKNGRSWLGLAGIEQCTIFYQKFS